MRSAHCYPGSRSTAVQGWFPGRRPHLPVVQLADQSTATIQARAPAPHVAAAVARAQPQAPPAPARPVQAFGQAEVFEVPPSLNLSGRGGGQRMPEPVQQKMESVFGADFSDVRVHIGHEAASIGAIAFTHGSNIFFSQGSYNPTTPQGQQLLGHELTHVLQQRAGRVRNPLGSGVAVVQDPGMEAEADRMGMQVANAPEPVQAKPAAGGTHAAQAKGANDFRVTRGPIQGGQQQLTIHRGGQSIGQAEIHSESLGVARVYNLKVDPAFRGQGAGDALLRAAARAGASMGKHRIALDSEDNGSGHLTRWYQSEGFHRVGTNDRGMAMLEAPAQALLVTRGGPSRRR